MLDESSDASKQHLNRYHGRNHSRHALVQQNPLDDIELDLGSDIFNRMPDFDKSKVELNKTEEDVNVTLTGNFLVKPRGGISIDLTQHGGSFEID